METIFEYRVTKLEKEILASCSPHRRIIDKEDYLKYTDIDTINADLYRLFTLRDEVDCAETYVKKIKDTQSISSISFF
ncbi:MAG: hypothetical protein P4L35_13310 [Ignavibacteriaceae bacterium]|nr:hypothetical protein [Ignavibacteriaceae bacterium]